MEEYVVEDALICDVVLLQVLFSVPMSNIIEMEYTTIGAANMRDTARIYQQEYSAETVIDEDNFQYITVDLLKTVEMPQQNISKAKRLYLQMQMLCRIILGF